MKTIENHLQALAAQISSGSPAMGVDQLHGFLTEVAKNDNNIIQDGGTPEGAPEGWKSLMITNPQGSLLLTRCDGSYEGALIALNGAFNLIRLPRDIAETLFDYGLQHGN